MKNSHILYHPALYCLAGVVAGIFHPFRASGWGLIVLGGMICLYAFMAAKEEGADRREVGDNCYFIGFVYTLVVITWSLVLDADKLIGDGADGGDLRPLLTTVGIASGEIDGKPAPDLRPLLTTVGIALGTSVIGMITRFFLSHGVLAPETKFDQIVEATALAASRLDSTVQRMAKDAESVASAMKSSAGAMTAYANKAREEAEKVGGELNKAAAALLDNFAARVAETLQTELLGDMRQKFGEAIDEHKGAVRQIGEQFNASIASLNDAATVAAANVKSVNRALDSMEARLGGERWKEMKRVLEDFAGQVGQLNAALQSIAKQQDAAISEAGRDIERLRSIHGAFDGMLKDMRDDINTAAKIKEDYRREYQKAADAALKETHALYARLIGGAELALAEMGKLTTLAGDLRTIADHIEKDKQQ